MAALFWSLPLCLSICNAKDNQATTAPRVLSDAQGRCNSLNLRIVLSENRFRFSGRCVDLSQGRRRRGFVPSKPARKTGGEHHGSQQDRNRHRSRDRHRKIGRYGAAPRNGWNTVFCGRRQAVLEEAIDQPESAEAKALAIACDVTKPDEVDRLFETAVEVFGRVDLLFNNAGRGYKSTLIDEIPVDVWNDVVGINLTGSFLCARKAFGMMRRQSPMGGRIINNGSVSAYSPRPGSVPYTATKHAITGLTRTLALDGRPFDIACGQIDIGNALTEMAASMTVGVPQANGSIAPEAMMDVQRVAEAVVHMASLPLDANVLFMTVMATKMPYVGRGMRQRAMSRTSVIGGDADRQPISDLLAGEKANSPGRRGTAWRSGNVPWN